MSVDARSDLQYRINETLIRITRLENDEAKFDLIFKTIREKILSI